MNKTKSLVAAMMFATASFASTSALAQDTSSPPAALDLTDNSAFFGDTFAADNSGSTFADRFTFSVSDPVPQTFDAIVSSISRTADTGLDVTALALYDSANTLITSGSMANGGRIDVWTLSNTAGLSAGDYYVQVSGTMVSNTAGSFGGAVMLAPVPEPETYGMLLGGLGILAFLARRSKVPQA
jgi:hypothetical protein